MAVVPSLSTAAIISVPGDQPTLNAAAAAAADRDTVLLAPGTHAGGIYINGKSLTIASWFLATQDTATISQTVISGVVGNVCGGDPDCRGDAVLEYGPNSGGAVIGVTVTNGLKGIRSGSVVDLTWCHVVGTEDGTNYTNGGGGTFRDCLFAYNGDDGVDLNAKVNVRIIHNVIRDNADDGIEFRLYPYSGPVLTTEITDNFISGNREDGIQFIDYADSSSRVLRVERNILLNNTKVNLSCISAGPTDTVEDFFGAPTPEPIYVLHNTFVGGGYGIAGGVNLVALNNIFKDLGGTGLRRVTGNSIASYNLFWNIATHFDSSNVDLGTSQLADPLLAPDYTPLAGSPAIDGGTAFFQWLGRTVLEVPPSSYLGSAPDLGKIESGAGGPPPGNRAPGVDAGPERTLTLPADALLAGSVTDDGLPNPPGTLTTLWSVGNGPGPVSFLDAAAVDTRAAFTVAGTYILRLTASDGERATTDSVRITVQPEPPREGATVERRIASGGDDVEESSLGKVSLSSTDLELVYDAGIQTVGLRFVDMAIPSGATITRAYIQFQVDETQGEATSLTIQGEAADNAGIFGQGSYFVSTLPRTVASAGWSPPVWSAVGEAGVAQRAPDFPAVIQEIVTRPGWVSGNAIVIIITGTGHRTAESYDGLPAGAPLLHVEYSTNTAPSVDAGADQVISLAAAAVLGATVADDGRPNPPSAVTASWIAAAGPGPVTFEDSGAVDTRAWFTVPGIYVLRLTVSDGQLSGTDSLQVTVDEAVTAVEGETPQFELAIHRSGLNPGRETLRVELSLPGAARALLEVLDVAGRRVAFRDLGSPGPGRHAVELRERLASGVYFLRLRHAGRTRIARTVIVR